MADLIQQLTLMIIEAAFAASVLLVLFHVRHTLGRAPLYTTVGVFYYLATLLAASTFIKVTPSLMLSPGSVALFPASVFAVLLVYIREDAKEARNMIYGLLAANVSASILGLIVVQHLHSTNAFRPIALPPELFLVSPRLFIVGTLALYADAILIILAYEAISRSVHSLFARVWLSLAAVLVLDTLLFVTGGFIENPAYSDILLSGIIGKVAAAVLYSSALAHYLPRGGVVDARDDGRVRPGLGDLFQVLTYRQRYEALRAEATRDPLTGIYNRGFFDETLRNQVAVARSMRVPVTVVIVDVDNFKRINDEHGHSEGDRALDVIAKTLVTAARATDVVCRYGGEEFCVILPRTSSDSAVAIAERIRSEVTKTCKREDVAGGARITVTIGLATCPVDGADTDSLMRIADRRLYEGKKSGRDRVVAA